MSDVVIHGPPQSSYVRSARMVCHEKGVRYDLRPLELKSEAHLALHPFGRVPVLQHKDVTLYETSAILRYVDATFPGPSLVPGSVRAQAEMEQWISTINSYFYGDIVTRYVLQYVFPKGPGGAPDRTVIDATVPSIERDLGVLERWLEGRRFLAGGDAPSLADLLLAPILAYAGMFPEAARILEGSPNIRRLHAALSERPSFKETVPPPPR